MKNGNLLGFIADILIYDSLLGPKKYDKSPEFMVV